MTLRKTTSGEHTCNVTTGASRNDHLHLLLPDGLGHLVVGVDEVPGLDENPGPVDGIDGAEVVLLDKGPVPENGLDGNVQVIGGALNYIQEDRDRNYEQNQGPNQGPSNC